MAGWSSSDPPLPYRRFDLLGDWAVDWAVDGMVDAAASSYN
jgi:hypothetical protein